MGGRDANRLSLAKKIVFSLVPTIALLGLAEIAARVFYAEPPAILLRDPVEGTVNLSFPEYFVRDPRLFWALRPGLRRPTTFWGDVTNSRGFRMRTEPGERREAVRVLCLGDSCTYGVGLPLEEAWPAILDRLLEGAEVVNAGVPGYSSYQGRILFEDRCEDLEPDALVVAFGHNDVLTWLTKHQGKLVEISDRDRADHFNYTRTWSRLLQWLLSRRLRPPASPAGDGSPEATLPRVPIEEFRANLEYFAGRAPVVVFVAWARRSALEPDRRERFPTRRLRRYRAAILEMEQAGHVVLDVEELFRKSGLPPERLFLDDVHATKEGGELVARWLARRLRLHVPALRHR